MLLELDVLLFFEHEISQEFDPAPVDFDEWEQAVLKKITLRAAPAPVVGRFWTFESFTEIYYSRDLSIRDNRCTV